MEDYFAYWSRKFDFNKYLFGILDFELFIVMNTRKTPVDKSFKKSGSKRN